MPACVIRDVTGQDGVIAAGAKKYPGETKTTITPFEKVLEEQMALDAAGKNTAGAEETGRTKRLASLSGTTAGSGTRVQLKDIFERASKKYDISYDFLVAVAKAESDFNTKCVSSAGAKGIMQLMPDECKEFHVTDPYDAEQNIMASAKLLKAHLKKYNGDYILAAAAYNAGSGAVSKYGGVPPYSETQNYVKKIRQFMQEGVKVPKKTVKVSYTGSSEGSGGATSVTSQDESGGSAEKTGDTAQDNDEAQSGRSVVSGAEQATESDFEKVTVAIGTGVDKVTMTYGAYLKYLELGTTGVG